jgi:putative phosphoesterase
MLVGVVSDTHGRDENALAAARMLDSLGVQRVLHCGDIGTPSCVQAFSHWPTDFVFGNCDGNVQELRTAIQQAGLNCHERFGKLEYFGRKIALLHSDDYKAFDNAVHRGGYDLVCYGHTHVARCEKIGAALVLNPGALHRANPFSLAVVDLDTLTATIVMI